MFFLQIIIYFPVDFISITFPFPFSTRFPPGCGTRLPSLASRTTTNHTIFCLFAFYRRISFALIFFSTATTITGIVLRTMLKKRMHTIMNVHLDRTYWVSVGLAVLRQHISILFQTVATIRCYICIRMYSDNVCICFLLFSTRR